MKLNIRVLDLFHASVIHTSSDYLYTSITIGGETKCTNPGEVDVDLQMRVKGINLQSIPIVFRLHDAENELDFNG